MSSAGGRPADAAGRRRPPPLAGRRRPPAGDKGKGEGRGEVRQGGERRAFGVTEKLAWLYPHTNVPHGEEA